MSYLQLHGTSGRPQAVGIDANKGLTLPLWLWGMAGVAALSWFIARHTGPRRFRGRSKNKLMRSAERLISSRERQLPKVFIIKAEGRPKPYRHRTMKAYNKRVEMLKKWKIPYTVEVVEDPPEPGGK